MILVTAAAIAFSIANGGVASERPDAPSQVAATQPGTEAQTSSYESREVPIGRFDRLTVSGPFKVGVLVSDEPARLHLVGPPAMLADAIATVEGDTLTIRFREGATWSWNPGSGVNVVIFTPNLASANTERAADVEIMGVRGETFTAATDGSGAIVLRGLQVGYVALGTGGSGSITAEGSAREGLYAVGSSGSIDAKRLRVERASIGIDGSGSVYADVSGTANVSMRGSGRVDVVGGGTCITQPANSPRVDCR